MGGNLGKRAKKSEKTRLFLRAISCSCLLRKSHAIFGGDRVGKKNEGLLNMYIFFFRERPNSKNLDVRHVFFCPPFRFRKILFPLPRRGRRKKHANRKDGRPLRFQRNLRGPAIRDCGVPSDSRVFLTFFSPTHLWVGKKNEGLLNMYIFFSRTSKFEEFRRSASPYMAREKNPPGGPISDRAPAFFYRAISWVGKKILRHAPANPFMRFARRAVNLRRRPFLRFRWKEKSWI